jgi:hypothetical protein
MIDDWVEIRVNPCEPASKSSPLRPFAASAVDEQLAVLSWQFPVEICENLRNLRMKRQ